MTRTLKITLLLITSFVLVSACNTTQNVKNGLLHVIKDMGEYNIELSSVPLITDTKFDNGSRVNSLDSRIIITGDKDDVLTKFQVDNNNIDEFKKFIYTNEKNQQCIDIEDYKIKEFDDLLINLVEKYKSPLHVYNEDVKTVNMNVDDILLLWSRIEIGQVASNLDFDSQIYKMVDKYNQTEFDDYQYIFEDKYLYFYKVYYASQIGLKKVTFTFHPYDSMPEVSEIEVNVSLK
ncbi:MAG: hypothetical protein HGA95_02030 [Caldiserica bacterium]|nr:hypothetical protein [Caldisericota bacterium]